jgi:type IV secretory pathway protease TraF
MAEIAIADHHPMNPLRMVSYLSASNPRPWYSVSKNQVSNTKDKRFVVTPPTTMELTHNFKPAKTGYCSNMFLPISKIKYKRADLFLPSKCCQSMDP